ncbi:hypothetical protein FG386_000352 [Cryptosporidium ryanae]|uniref:uncharacterized protein n=1 Tax=Cryptosporidium ryanae TaxID=515981 RepID=UPI003519E7D8|nr:hypothetical protein FG386_000352 [Cryptosporidium ryanae]
MLLDDESSCSRKYTNLCKLGYECGINNKESPENEDLGIENGVGAGCGVEKNSDIDEDKENIDSNIIFKKQRKSIECETINNQDQMKYICNNYCDNSLFKDGIDKFEIKEMNPYYILQCGKMSMPQIGKIILNDTGYDEDKKQSYHGICAGKNSDCEVQAICDSSVIDETKSQESLSGVIISNGAACNSDDNSLSSEQVSSPALVFGFEYQQNCNIDINNGSEMEKRNEINSDMCINSEDESGHVYTQCVDRENGDGHNVFDLIKEKNSEKNMIDSVIGTRLRTTSYYHTQMRSSGLDKFTVVDVNGKRSILHEVETQAQLMPSIPGVYFDKKQIGYRVRYHNSYVGWVALSRYSSIKDAYECAKKLWLDARNKSKEGSYMDEDDCIIEGQRRNASILISGKSRGIPFYEDKSPVQDINTNQEHGLFISTNEMYEGLENINRIKKFNENANLQESLSKEGSAEVDCDNGICFFQTASTENMLSNVVNPLKMKQNNTPSNNCFELKLSRKENRNIDDKIKNNRYSAIETMKKLYMATYDYMEKWPSKDGHYTIHWSNTSDLSLFLYGENCEFTHKRQKTQTRRNKNSDIVGCNHSGAASRIINSNYIGKGRVGHKQQDNHHIIGFGLKQRSRAEGIGIGGILEEEIQEMEEINDREVEVGGLCGNFGYIW